MIDQEKDAIYLCVYPFKEGIDVTKLQGLKILEEASEAYQAFDDYMKTLGMKEYFDTEENYNTVTNAKAVKIIEECYDTIQAAVNLVMALTGGDLEATQEAFVDGISLVVGKNLKRGYYGEYTGEESDETGHGTDEEINNDTEESHNV